MGTAWRIWLISPRHLNQLLETTLFNLKIKGYLLIFLVLNFWRSFKKTKSEIRCINSAHFRNNIQWTFRSKWKYEFFLIQMNHSHVELRLHMSGSHHRVWNEITVRTRKSKKKSRKTEDAEFRNSQIWKIYVYLVQNMLFRDYTSIRYIHIFKFL